MTRKTRVVVLTLMGASTIAYFTPGCDREDSRQTTATTRGSGAHHHGGPIFVGGRSPGVSGSTPHSSNVTRGGFGSSSPSSSVHA